MKPYLLLPALAILASTPAFAEKIGVVDADAIRQHYAKAQASAKTIQDAVADAKKDLGTKEAAVVKLRGEAEAAAKDAENPTLNDAARAAKKSELQTKAQAFIAARDQLVALQQRMSSTIQQRGQEFDREILGEIREKAAVVAKEKGLDLIIPSGVTFYAADSVNVTDAVLKKLNEAYAANPVTPAAPVVAPAEPAPAPAAK